MAQANDKTAIILQNLKDAGCSDTLIEKCLNLVKEQNQTALLKALTVHRKNLLNKVHQNQKKLDCLDFLIFKVRKR